MGFFLLDWENASCAQLGLQDVEYLAALLSLQLLEFFSRQVLDFEGDLLDGLRVESILLDEIEDIVLADCVLERARVVVGVVFFEKLHGPVLLVDLDLGVEDVV